MNPIVVVYGMVAGLAGLGVVRWLRWLAWFQQKEYRLDRLMAFWSTTEGKQELGRLLPTRQDFSRTGLKRPVVTARVAVVAALSAVIIASSLWLGWLIGPWLGVVALLVYVGIPLIVLLAVLPSTFAAVLLTEVYLWWSVLKLRRSRPTIIGIGGCYGKTSTKLLLQYVLSGWQPTFATPKSFNTRYSAAASIVKHYQGEGLAIIEYGTYKIGEIAELTRWWQPTLAMETGFTEQHLSLFGSVKNIIAAEGELGAALPKGAPLFCHAADEGALKIAAFGAKKSGADIIPYTGPSAVVKLHHVQVNDQGALCFRWDGHDVQTHLIGAHYAVNVAGVIAVATHLGMPAVLIRERLQSFMPSDRFVTTHTLPSGALVIDDGYAANPLGMMAALELGATLKKIRRAKKVVLVFGGIVDLGSASEQIHRDLAQAAEKVVSTVIYTGDVGQTAFSAVFGERCLVATPETFQWNALDADLVLLEGRVPMWIQRQREAHV